MARLAATLFGAAGAAVVLVDRDGGVLLDERAGGTEAGTMAASLARLGLMTTAPRRIADVMSDPVSRRALARTASETPGPAVSLAPIVDADRRTLGAVIVVGEAAASEPLAAVRLEALGDLAATCAELARIAPSAPRVPVEARQPADESGRLMFETNPVPMFVHDRRTMAILDVNAAACALYGWTRERMRTMSLLDIRPEDEHARLIAQLGAEDPKVGEIWRHRRANGTELLVKSWFAPTRFADREAILVAVSDVTELETARAVLRLRNEALSRLTSELQDRTDELTEAHRLARLGTWRMAANRFAMSWSDDLMTMLGRERGAVAETRPAFLGFIEGHDRDTVRAVLDAVVETRTPRQTEFRLRAGDGTVRHLRMAARPVTDESDTLLGVFGVCQDVSEQKEAELALLRSERLRTLGQLTGGVAHDFNNLLTVTTLGLGEAMDALPEDHSLQSALAAALEATRQGAELTARLLAYARRAPLQPERVALEPFFAEFTPLLQRSLWENQTLDVFLEPGVGETMVDPGQLESAIMNLVLNARDAIGRDSGAAGLPRPGRVSIAARSAHLVRGPEAADDELTSGRYVVISVSDNGSGIEPALLGRVFEPFFTTKPPSSGGGLGLSMVYGFARQSGGHAAIESTVGVGTTVTIYLPEHGPPPAPPARAARPTDSSGTQPWTAHGLRVLVVEDRVAVLTVLTRMLRHLGVDVTAVESAGAALVALSAVENSATATEPADGERGYHLLFADLNLPGAIDGARLGQQAKARAPGLKVLLTSGALEAPSTAARLSADGFIAKPFRRDDLSAKLMDLFPRR